MLWDLYTVYTKVYSVHFEQKSNENFYLVANGSGSDTVADVHDQAEDRKRLVENTNNLRV